MACDLHGVMMPEMRSGARRSKRLGDLQPTPQPVDQVENWLLPSQNKTRRRIGGGRGRGGNAPLAKGPSVAKPVRPTEGGRRRGIRLIDLDPEPPCEVRPEAVAIGVRETVLNRAGVADIAMEGGSADKMMGVEEEASTTPVPERVTSFSIIFPICDMYLAMSFIRHISWMDAIWHQSMSEYFIPLMPMFSILLMLYVTCVFRPF